jgi:hypothetical protein
VACAGTPVRWKNDRSHDHTLGQRAAPVGASTLMDVMQSFSPVLGPWHDPFTSLRFGTSAVISSDAPRKSLSL